MKFKRKPPAGNVRRVTSTGQNIRGVMMNKAGRLVQFESWMERSLLLRLDRDPKVRDYGSQPEVFKYRDPVGQEHSYTPDFIVWRGKDRVEIHEVSLSERRIRQEIQQREAAGRAICQGRGWLYLIHTELTLPQGAELANLPALFHYRPSVYAHPVVIEATRKYLVAVGKPLCLASLGRQIALEANLPSGMVMAALGHLLWHGRLDTDLQRLIFVKGEAGPEVQVWLKGEVSYER